MSKEHDNPGSTETRADQSLDPRQPHAPNQIEIGDIVSGLDPAELVEVNRIAPFGSNRAMRNSLFVPKAVKLPLTHVEPSGAACHA